MSGLLSFIILGCLVGLISGQCPVGCNDNPPEPDAGEVQYSCAEQKLFGQCNANFMKGYCECTCGTCTIAVEEKAVVSTALEIAASSVTPVEPYPFLDEMTCIQLLGSVKAETDIRYEFDNFDGLDNLVSHPQVQQCIKKVKLVCNKGCCGNNKTKCVCNKAGNNCKWQKYTEISNKYMGLSIFENAANKLCKCPLPQ